MMYSLVIPVYKNEDCLPDLLSTLVDMNRVLDDKLEVVLVIDGSPDNCYSILREKLPTMPFRSHLLLHSRNYGSFAAVRNGLAAATGDYFAVMAADMQEPPELAQEFFRLLAADEADVAMGTRDARHDDWRSKMSSGLFWWAYKKFVIPDMPAGGIDMFGCNRQFRHELLALDESHSSLIGLIFWLGFRRKMVAYERRQRQQGVSAWTFSKKINYLMDSVFAFSDLPIKLLISVGTLGMLFAGGFGLLVVLLKAAGSVTVPGYAATVLMVLFFGAMNLMGLGIVGAYVWRAYGNTQGRPLAVLRRTENFAGTKNKT
jgi:glycosyltransferase involved in cell wall biosynthesis